MASPQIEDGHIDIANEIVEALARTQLNGYESRFLWALWRKTYGWHKKEDWVSDSQIVEMTGLKKQHVWRTKQKLIERNMVTKNGYKIMFQKDYTRWKELPKMVTVTKSGIGVTNSGIKVTKFGANKRNYTKETITKERGYILTLTPKQKETLKKEYPHVDLEVVYKKFQLWQEANGKRFTNVLAAFRVWLVEDNTRNKPKYIKI